ncbi:MAG: adventurous gliding motility protein CglE [Deltaproteobacteria bacterium]|nr:adventurous gliding motility protein CglE [Deltaproteobacteria bacterium]
MRSLALVLAVVVATPSAALAQDPQKAPDIAAVERGAFLESDFGASMIVTGIDGRTFGLGLLTGIFVGYDVLPVLSLSIGAAALVAPGSPDNAPLGDLLFISPQLNVQFAFVTTERNFLYVRGSGGFGLALPDQVSGQQFGGQGPTFSAVVGFERYTQLRHFSFGVRAGVFAVTRPGFGIAAAIVPGVKYTF